MDDLGGKRSSVVQLLEKANFQHCDKVPYDTNTLQH